MIKNCILPLVLLLCFSNTIIRAQNENVKDKALKVYIDCNSCDSDYIRKELTFVNYVRDRLDAQVHILATTEFTGSGGRKQTFFFLGQKEFKGQADTLNFSVTADATSDEIRSKQLNLIRLGLVRYAAKTPMIDRITVSFEENDDEESVTDRWNSWVFEIDGSAYFNGEQSYSYFSSYNSIGVQRVTDDLKVEFEVEYNFSKSKYVVDDTTYFSTRNDKEFDHMLVKSINNHWSYGYKFSIESSLYQNLDLFIKAYPALEYNLFPYSESNRKQLRFIYSAGMIGLNYIDTTIYDKTKETVFGQQLGIAAQFKEKWGTVNVSLEGGNFFHDFSMKHLELYSYLNLRLFKGLSLYLQGGVSLIHDQISLPKGEVSSEDVLLRRRQLESQYFYWGGVGLTYSFGSIYNNVVNPRFGN